MLQTTVKKYGIPLLFAGILFLLGRPLMSFGIYHWSRIIFFPEGLLVLFCTGAVLLRRNALADLLKRSGSAIQVIFLILLVSGLGHWLKAGFLHPEYLGLALAWSMVPLFGALYRRELERVLPPVMSAVWILSLASCVITKAVSPNMFGLTGNWNWSSVLLLISAPFAMQTIPFRKKKAGYLLIGIVTFLFMVRLQSRAAFLGCGFALWLFLFLTYRKYRKWILYGTLALGIIGYFSVLLLFPAEITSRLDQEVRPELWKGVCRMIQDHPYGVSPVGFENAYIPYKTIRYFMNRMSAIRTVHPHNEFLYLAATLGIPAMFAFLAWSILAFLRISRDWDAGRISVCRKPFLFAFAVLFFSGLLDLTFHAWPLGTLSLLFFGMFAFPEPVEKMPDPWRSPCGVIGIAVIVLTFSGAGAFFAGSLCWERSHHAFQRNDFEHGKSFADAAFRLAPCFPDLVYRAAMDSASRDPDFSMKCIENMRHSPWKDFAHIHGLAARLYALSGRDALAISEYEADARCFPLQILPHVGILTAYGRLRMFDRIPTVNAKIRELIHFRHLTKPEITAILQNPEFDMHPHKIHEKPVQGWNP